MSDSRQFVPEGQSHLSHARVKTRLWNRKLLLVHHITGASMDDLIIIAHSRRATSSSGVHRGTNQEETPSLGET